jgi:hypothetical protein
VPRPPPSLPRWPILAGMTCVTPLQAECRALRSLERAQEAPGHASPAMTRRDAHAPKEDVREAESEAQKGAVTAQTYKVFYKVE